jgi:hypothetical protein
MGDRPKSFELSGDRAQEQLLKSGRWGSERLLQRRLTRHPASAVGTGSRSATATTSTARPHAQHPRAMASHYTEAGDDRAKRAHAVAEGRHSAASASPRATSSGNESTVAPRRPTSSSTARSSAATPWPGCGGTGSPRSNSAVRASA